MNCILFEPDEPGRPLSKHDGRAVHLVKVLHKKPGDEFEAGILGGMRGRGRLERIAEDGSIEFSLNLNEPPPPRSSLHIGVGFSRPIQMRRILREMANMGVRAISFFGTDSGEKSYRETTLLSDGGARAAFIEGAAQGRDTILPALSVYRNLDEWLKNAAGTMPDTASGAFCICADNIASGGSFAGLPRNVNDFIVAVGSERGWSEGERGLFREAGFHSLSLGERPLRTETACVAAAALVSMARKSPFSL
jgi:RsmE family RNA methyltransferase